MSEFTGWEKGADCEGMCGRWTTRPGWVCKRCEALAEAAEALATARAALATVSAALDEAMAPVFDDDEEDEA